MSFNILSPFIPSFLKNNNEKKIMVGLQGKSGYFCKMSNVYLEYFIVFYSLKILNLFRV